MKKGETLFCQGALYQSPAVQDAGDGRSLTPWAGGGIAGGAGVAQQRNVLRVDASILVAPNSANAPMSSHRAST